MRRYRGCKLKPRNPYLIGTKLEETVIVGKYHRDCNDLTVEFVLRRRIPKSDDSTDQFELPMFLGFLELYLYGVLDV